MRKGKATLRAAVYDGGGRWSRSNRGDMHRYPRRAFILSNLPGSRFPGIRVSGKSKLEYIWRYEETNAYQSVTFSGGKHGLVIMDKVLSERSPLVCIITPGCNAQWWSPHTHYIAKKIFFTWTEPVNRASQLSYILHNPTNFDWMSCHDSRFIPRVLNISTHRIRTYELYTPQPNQFWLNVMSWLTIYSQGFKYPNTSDST